MLESLKMITFFVVGIQYCMIGLFPSWSAFWAMYLTCIMIALSATGTFFTLSSYHFSPGYGYMISALAPTIEAANAIAPPLMVPLLLFGGFFLQSDSVPPWFIWLKYISWFYYGAENLYVAQWREGGYCMEINNPIQVTENASEIKMKKFNLGFLPKISSKWKWNMPRWPHKLRRLLWNRKLGLRRWISCFGRI